LVKNNKLFCVYSKKLLGSGAQSKACRERSAVRIDKAGDHSFLRISRQIAPVYEDMFGCQILVSNFIFGGL